MLNLFYAFVMMIVSYAIQAAMAPKPQTPISGQLDVPVAQEGGTISVIFGTVLVKDANVIWYGDAATSEIRSGGGKK